FQEVNCNEGEKTHQQETDLESMYHKTSSLVRKKKRIFPDYSRANRDISNEKLAVNECSHLSQNPLISRDVSEENQTAVKTKKLKKKDNLKKCKKNNLKKKSICIKSQICKRTPACLGNCDCGGRAQCWGVQPRCVEQRVVLAVSVRKIFIY
ncbi:hypothetical protein TNIN_390201, partial [Trichonephila inaurata madagascariensis]